jgi:uncharacterized membrane protein
MTRTRTRPRPERLDLPRQSSRAQVPYPDSEFLGRVSESVARFFGTARFLVIQTVIVVVWIVLNVIAAAIRWDPYPFILLNLAFSTQAAYAAPFILLAQNRQADRDKVQIAQDRDQEARQRANTEYLGVELAAVRLTQGNAATRDYIDSRLARLVETLREQVREDIRSELAARPIPAPQSAEPVPSGSTH